MYCADCGHNNPSENRFCGMCGARLSLTGTSRAPEIASAGPGPVQAAPVKSETAAAVAEPKTSGPAVVASEYAPPRGYGFLRTATPQPEEKHVVEEPTTLSGPSFLGLSGPAPGDEGYSYLFEDEQPSRVGRYLGLILLIVLGTATYLKWQPLKAWVVNTVNTTLSRVQQQPAERKAAPTTADATIATTPTVSEPAGNLPPVEQSVNPSSAADKDAGIEPAKSSSPPEGAAVPAVTPIPPAAPKERAHKDDAADGAADTSKADLPAGRRRYAAKERPSAARKRSAPEPPAGNELVAAGEKYLYGRGVRRNCQQALTYFRAAADKHNVRAYSHLGSLYATGQCVPLDRAQAYSFYSRALAEDRSNPYYERNLTMLWRDMSSEERQRATRNRTF